MAVNSTTTTTVTSATHTVTATVTFTRVSTSIQQLVPTNPLGIPYELWALLLGSIIAVSYLFFKINVKGIPTFVTFVRRNGGTALQLSATKALDGLFINVREGTGKRIIPIKEKGVAIDVTVLPPKFEAYVETKGRELEEEVIADMERKGFKVREKRSKKDKLRGYLLNYEPLATKTKAFLDVSLGGLKHANTYTTIEGSGETIDWQEIISGTKGSDPGNAAVMQELRAGVRAMFADWANAMKGTLQTLILPMATGAGLMGMIIFLIFLATGHFK